MIKMIFDKFIANLTTAHIEKYTIIDFNEVDMRILLPEKVIFT